MKSQFTNPLTVVKYYPQRVIVLVNAVVAVLVYALSVSPEGTLVAHVGANALLVFFYGEPATQSKAWAEEEWERTFPEGE